MNDKLLDFLEAFDLFKRPMFLYLGRNKYNATFFGFLLSLAIYGFLMHSFFISDMFSKKNPLIYDQGLVAQNRPELKFNFAIPLYVANSAGEKFNEPSIFKVKVFNYDMITDPTTNNGKVPRFAENKELKPCEPSDFENPEEFAKQGFKNAYCMKNKNVTIGGYWEESTVKYLYTYVERCNNKTSEIVCKSDEEIDSFFARKFYGIQMPNTFFDMNDYTEAVKYTWRTEYQLIDVNMLKRLKIFIKKVEFNDDKGYLFEEKNQEETFTYDYTEIDFKNQNRSAIMFEIFLYSSSVIQKKVRKYQKASEVLAAIGGQASCLMIFGFLLTSLQNFVEMTSKVINNLYRFQEKKEKKNDSNNSKDNKISKNNPKNEIKTQFAKKNVNTSNLYNNMSASGLKGLSGIPIGSEVETNNRIDKDLKDLEVKYTGYIAKKNIENDSCELEDMSMEFNEPNLSRIDDSKAYSSPKNGVKREKILADLGNDDESRFKIKFGVEDFLKMNISRFFRRKLGFKDKLFLKAQERFLNEIDILNILRRLQELEKLKLILLSPQQLELFSLLQKPMIYADEDSDEEITSKIHDETESFSPHYRMSIMMGSMTKNQRDKDKTDLNKTQERAMRYYRNLKRSTKRTEIDNRLLSYIDERLKEAEKNL